MGKDPVTVDCPMCEARVNAEIICEQHVFDYADEVLPDRKISFARCPDCRSPLLTRQEQTNSYLVGNELEVEWRRVIRLWPEPTREAHAAIPAIVQVSLDEAHRCHLAGAHTACAVMCGRALEGVCVHFGTKGHLFTGLRELHERGVIDSRLLEWGEQLRKHRNLAAHATGDRISREDSTDLLEFVSAICDYIFVLTARFEAFMKRQAPESGDGQINGDHSA